MARESIDECWFESSGHLRCGHGGYIVVDVNNEILQYYRNLIPKTTFVRQQKYDAHISVVRDWEKVPKPEFFFKNDKELINFEYSNIIETDNIYFWIKVRCERIKEIRQELGLNPTVGWFNGFHITLGNMKELE